MPQPTLGMQRLRALTVSSADEVTPVCVERSALEITGRARTNAAGCMRASESAWLHVMRVGVQSELTPEAAADAKTGKTILPVLVRSSNNGYSKI